MKFDAVPQGGAAAKVKDIRAPSAKVHEINRLLSEAQ
jgi:hypothetical protein